MIKFWRSNVSCCKLLLKGIGQHRLKRKKNRERKLSVMFKHPKIWRKWYKIKTAKSEIWRTEFASRSLKIRVLKNGGKKASIKFKIWSTKAPAKTCLTSTISWITAAQDLQQIAEATSLSVIPRKTSSHPSSLWS